MRIYLLRHGETEWNREGRKQGGADSPLTPLGVAQATACAQLLAAELTHPADAFLVTSPLGRARRTGEILRAHIALRPERCSESELLAEHHLGYWQGLTNAEVEALHPGELARRRADRWSYLVPGGESYALVQARAARWLSAQRTGTVLVVVAHAMLNRALLCAFLGLAGSEALERDDSHTRIHVLEDRTLRVLDAQLGSPAASP